MERRMLDHESQPAPVSIFTMEREQGKRWGRSMAPDERVSVWYRGWHCLALDGVRVSLPSLEPYLTLYQMPAKFF
jgi:hypothetical protein